MDVFRMIVVFSAVMVLWILPGVSAASSGISCSCYSFHKNSSTRLDSNNYCKRRQGYLVSMETEDEWKFIKEQIENRKTDGNNEWWIGLQRTNDGNWTWTSNHTLTYDDKLLEEQQNETAFATIALNQSSSASNFFIILENEELSRRWICEYPNRDCNQSHPEEIVCNELNNTGLTTTNTPTTASTTATVSTATVSTTTASTTTASTTTVSTTTTSTTTAARETTIKASSTLSPSTLPTQANSTKTADNTPVTTTKFKTESPITERTPKVAKLTSEPPTSSATTTTAATTTRRTIFEGSFLFTTISPAHECLPYPILALAISVSVFGGVTVLFFTGLFLFVILRKKFSKRKAPVEKYELVAGEYENHL